MTKYFLNPNLVNSTALSIELIRQQRTIESHGYNKINEEQLSVSERNKYVREVLILFIIPTR